MSTMNAGEYGLLMAINLNYDISSLSNLSMTITRPDKTAFTRSTPTVAIGVPPLTTNIGPFSANQYATYLTQVGDFPEPGEYLVRLAYTDGTKGLISDATSFMVNP